MVETERDHACSIAPYFLVHEGNGQAFRSLCEKFVDRTRQEPGCLYYGFSFNGNRVHCREAYATAEALLAHLENVGDLLETALQLADLIRLEIHGCEAELAKLRQPLSNFDIEYYIIEYGFRSQHA
jgi:quinol monooxygenase YgiN